MNEFVVKTHFKNMRCQVMRFDDSLLSIKYEGEVYTPAKAITETFALNFDLEKGDLLSLKDFASESDIIKTLEDGLFSIQKERHELAWPPHIAFKETRVLAGDLEHTYDFYFDYNYFYVIISGGKNSIHKLELAKLVSMY